MLSFFIGTGNRTTSSDIWYKYPSFLFFIFETILIARARRACEIRCLFKNYECLLISVCLGKVMSLLIHFKMN